MPKPMAMSAEQPPPGKKLAPVNKPGIFQENRMIDLAIVSNHFRRFLHECSFFYSFQLLSFSSGDDFIRLYSPLTLLTCQNSLLSTRNKWFQNSHLVIKNTDQHFCKPTTTVLNRPPEPFEDSLDPNMPPNK